MDRKTVIAVAAIIVIIVAGASIAAAGMNNSSPEKGTHTVTVQDSLGNDVTLEVPVTKLVTVNTNAAEFIHMFGSTKIVVGADSSCISTLQSIYGDVVDVGDYKTPSGEKIVQTGAKLVISQSSSRSLSQATEQALKDNYGITVLRIDCYGETMLSDIATLSQIIDTAKVTECLKNYTGTYDKIVDDVTAKAKEAGLNPSFLAMFTSMNKFYNVNSQLSKIIESLGGTNALTAMGDAPKSTTVTSGPAAEKVYDYGNTTGLDLVLIRGITGKTAESCYQVFLDYGGTYDFSKLDKGEASGIYVIETDVLSGPRDYIGYVCIAEAMGIDTGYDYDQMVKDFDTKYGFGIEYSYIMTKFPAAV